MSMRMLAVGAAVMVVAGCDSGKRNAAESDELTIVLKEDQSRIEREESALLEQRQHLAEAREQLRGDLERLLASQREPGANREQGPRHEGELRLLEKAVQLVAQQEQVSARREALERERELVRGQSDGADPAALTASIRQISDISRTVAQREQDIASRERALAQREAALALREAAIRGAASPAGGPEREVVMADVEQAYRELMTVMNSRGLSAEDLPAAPRRVFEAALKARKAGDTTNALVNLASASTAVASLQIDGDFVSRKMRRVSQLQQKQPPGPRVEKDIARLLEEVTTSFSDGRYPEANAGLNSILALVGR